MKSRSRFMLLAALIISLAAASAKARADSAREFSMSAAYGALAGTLVGTASLAFSDRPGDNLNKVARGASIGLYVGILLGVYVVSGGPSEDSDVAEQLKNQTSFKNLSEPRFVLVPVISEHGFEGAQANYSVLRF